MEIQKNKMKWNAFSTKNHFKSTYRIVANRPQLKQGDLFFVPIWR